MTAIILVIIIIILTAIIILLLIVVLVIASVLLIADEFVFVLEELIDLIDKPVMLDGIPHVNSNHWSPGETLFLFIMASIHVTYWHFLLRSRFVYAFEFTLLQISLLGSDISTFFIVPLPSHEVFLRIEGRRVVVQTLLSHFIVLLLHMFTFTTK